MIRPWFSRGAFFFVLLFEGFHYENDFLRYQTNRNSDTRKLLRCMKHFVNLQDGHDAYYCVVDLHSITVDIDRVELMNNTRALAALYIASGLNPKNQRSSFNQKSKHMRSSGWMLTCSPGWVSSSVWHSIKINLKEKTDWSRVVRLPNTHGSRYPTLWCGTRSGRWWQKQHIELTRDLAQRFNSRYYETFTLPEPIIAESGARIMSLTTPDKKMSKSDQNPKASSRCLTHQMSFVKSEICRHGLGGIVKFDREKQTRCVEFAWDLLPTRWHLDSRSRN